MVNWKSSSKSVILSDEQLKDIKETILENVLNVLTDIPNDIFPVIMDKVSDIINTNIKDYVSTSCSTKRHDNNVKGT